MMSTPLPSSTSVQACETRWVIAALSSAADAQTTVTPGSVPTTRRAASIIEKATCSWETTTTPTIGLSVLVGCVDMLPLHSTRFGCERDSVMALRI